MFAMKYDIDSSQVYYKNYAAHDLHVYVSEN